MKKLFFLTIFVSMFFLTACTITLGDSTYEVSMDGIKVLSDDEEDNLNEIQANDNEEIVNVQEGVNANQDSKAAKVVIDSCGNDLTVVYEFLPDDFPIPDCAIIDVDGTGEWRSEDNKKFSYHFTTVKHESEELYDLYKNYLERLNYTFKEDRVEAGYKFVSLDVSNDTTSFMINLHDTLDDGRVAVGVYYVIN